MLVRPSHRYSARILGLVAVSLTFVVNNSALTAQDEPVRQIYKAIGGPTAPRVSVHWNRYYDYAQTTDTLKRLAAAFPNLARLQSLGKSYGDREMWVITITNFQHGEELKKPGFWIDGSIHANEIQATEVAMYTAWFLLEMHNENSFIQRLLRERVFYILPIMSPDSRDHHFYQPNTTSSPRSGLRPVDDDRDGFIDEDQADDLNGDGHLTQMRIRDPNGRWKAHPKYPQLMIPVEDGEKGEFTLLGFEGLDNDEDGDISEDGPGYYDPNRDWPWNWQPKYVQSGAHRYPLSILENRLMAEFVMQRPNLAGAQSYHNTGGMLLRGPGSTTDRYQPADLQVYDVIGKHGEQLLPGYRYMNIAEDLYEVFGGEVDWFHQSLGVFTFTNELFTNYLLFHSQDAGGFGGNRERQAMFEQYLLFGDGLVPWTEVDHPKYGKVEVGGMKKNWGRQPPSFMLQEECHRNMAFTLYHADQMPLVAIKSVEWKRLADGVFEVTASIENPKVIPTHSAVDLQQKITRPNLITIAGENVNVALARSSTDVLFREAKVHEQDPHEVRLANFPGKSLTYVRWIVSGKGPFTITVDTVKGGQASYQGVLE